MTWITENLHRTIREQERYDSHVCAQTQSFQMNPLPPSALPPLIISQKETEYDLTLARPWPDDFS